MDGHFVHSTTADVYSPVGYRICGSGKGRSHRERETGWGEARTGAGEEVIRARESRPTGWWQTWALLAEEAERAVDSQPVLSRSPGISWVPAFLFVKTGGCLTLKSLIDRLALPSKRRLHADWLWTVPSTQSLTNARLPCRWWTRGPGKTGDGMESNKRTRDMASVCRADRSPLSSICRPLLPSLALPGFPCCLQPRLPYKQWEVSAKHGL